jgi:hypothetical protein
MLDDFHWSMQHYIPEDRTLRYMDECQIRQEWVSVMKETKAFRGPQRQGVNKHISSCKEFAQFGFYQEKVILCPLPAGY